MKIKRFQNHPDANLELERTEKAIFQPKNVANDGNGPNQTKMTLYFMFSSAMLPLMTYMVLQV